MLSNTQPLLNYIRDTDKLQQIRERLRMPTECLSNGIIPDYEWSKKVLGNTYQKVILATNGIEELGRNPDTEFTAIGGSCVLRTKCFFRLKAGFLTDLSTGEKVKISSIRQVADWIKDAISLDQIVETIGSYNGSRYCYISENELWTQKIIQALIPLFGKIDEKDVNYIRKSISISENRRYHIIKKYLELTSKKPIEIVRVIDTDILKDLEDISAQLLGELDISYSLIKEQVSKSLPKSTFATQSELRRYVYYSVLIGTMYTGKYFDLLQKKGYVSTPKGLIIEPWHHGSGELVTKILYELTNRFHPYLQSGINKNIAILVIDCPSNQRLIRYTSSLSIDSVPNIHNYHDFAKKNKKENLKQELWNYIPCAYNDHDLFMADANNDLVERIVQENLQLVFSDVTV